MTLISPYWKELIHKDYGIWCDKKNLQHANLNGHVYETEKWAIVWWWHGMKTRANKWLSDNFDVAMKWWLNIKNNIKSQFLDGWVFSVCSVFVFVGGALLLLHVGKYRSHLVRATQIEWTCYNYQSYSIWSQKMDLHFFLRTVSALTLEIAYFHPNIWIGIFFHIFFFSSIQFDHLGT